MKIELFIMWIKNLMSTSRILILKKKFLNSFFFCIITLAQKSENWCTQPKWTVLNIKCVTWPLVSRPIERKNLSIPVGKLSIPMGYLSIPVGWKSIPVGNVHPNGVFVHPNGINFHSTREMTVIKNFENWTAYHGYVAFNWYLIE